MLLPKEPRVSRSQLLTVQLRVDVTPADAEYDACTDYTIESIEPACSCRVEDFYRIWNPERSCDACWLEEVARCIGVQELLIPDLPVLDASRTIVLRGYMQSERFDSLEGADYEETFELESDPVVLSGHDHAP